MLHLVPIEPIEERYSAQWLRWFTNHLKQNHIDHTIYDPSQYLVTGETLTIENGEFLDVVKTNWYKAKQLDLIMEAFKRKKVYNGDSFLFLDGWFPGVEMLAYVRDGLNLNVGIYGIFHAGTWDQHDFLTRQGMESWARPLENSWFGIYNKIFVATEYHRQLLLQTRHVYPSMIDVIFFPMLTDWCNYYLGEDRFKDSIVFPHRLAPEKQPELFNAFQVQLKEKMPNKDFWYIVTKKQARNKFAYYKLLRQSQFSISFALQETWGIAMIESVLCNCIPIVPDRLSYSELYPNIFKYNGSYPNEDVAHAMDMIYYMLSNPTQLENAYRELNHVRERFIKWGSQAIPSIIARIT